MMNCGKQAEQGVPLQAEQADWLEDTDEEIDEQELEAHYSYMAKIQYVSPEGTSFTGQPLEQVQNHDESNVVDTNAAESVDERGCALLNLIANLCTTLLFIVASDAQAHDANLKLLCNFVEKFLGTVRFGNDQFAPILGYGDLIQGNVTIKRVYYVKGLNHNLFLVGQFRDADLEVAFRKSTCFSERSSRETSLLTGSPLELISTQYPQKQLHQLLSVSWLKLSPTPAWLWHRRLSHHNFDYINLLSKKMYNGLPKLTICQGSKFFHLVKGVKQKGSSYQTKAFLVPKARLNLLHMDLPIQDTHGLFSTSKDETPEFSRISHDEFNAIFKLKLIYCPDYRARRFLNKTLHAYFKEEGIEHQTSTPRTPEQNGVVERRNRTLVEAARTMLSASKLPLSFWAEAVATACYTQNRSIIISSHGKTAYHIINDRKPSIKHLHIFGCICYITRDGENLDKMKEKGDPCVMVGYSTQSKGYRVYNKRTRLIVESIHIKFDEIKEMMSDHNSSDLAPQQRTRECLFEKCLFRPSFLRNKRHQNYENSDPLPPRQICHDFRWTRDHPLEQVRGNPSMPVQTRRQLATDPEMCMFALTVSIVEPKNIKEAMADSAWIEAMQDELHQFDRLKVWELVDKPFGKMIIKLKWLWKNKKDKDQDFAPGEAIIQKSLPRPYEGKLCTQMDKASSKKAGLQIHQSPKGIFINQAKYALEILKKHNMDNCHSIGTPLATKPKLDVDLSGEPVDQSDYRSKIGSLMYLTSSRPLKAKQYAIDSGFELTAFSDADHAGCLDTRKSTSGGIQFLGDKLVSWMSKKQNCTAMSSAEAEYVALSTSCAQVMWMRTQLQDYGFNYNKIPL
ncbi:retrovirus-related pol polyprotein from transposon TNT 1-94 [Tanacetum coccineum]